MQYPHWLMVAGAVLVVMKPIDDYESALPAAAWPNWVLDGERVVLDIKEGNMEAHHRLRKKLQAILSRADAHPVLLERNLNLGKTSRSQAQRIKPAPRGSARIQRCPFSTSIARRTSRQSLRHGRELFSVDRCREPDIDHHRKCTSCCGQNQATAGNERSAVVSERHHHTFDRLHEHEIEGHATWHSRFRSARRRSLSIRAKPCW